MESIASDYRVFADAEARESSPLWHECAHAIAGDAEMLGWIATLPPLKRQPNLVLTAVRFVAGTPANWPDFRERWAAHRDEVTAIVLARYTQTNEAARAASWYPVLASLPQPVALLEVGASAGLCLIPDRYRYDYDGVPAGDPASPLTIACRVTGDMPAPGPVTVAWRAGFDLNPLDITDAGDVRWLETLVWPGMDARLVRLRAAIALAAADPPRIVTGNLNTDLDAFLALAASAPADATLVVHHSATLYYVDPGPRRAFVDAVGALPGHWIAHEGPGVLPEVVAALPEPVPTHDATQIVSLDGRPVAFAGAHGGRLRWL